MPESSFSAESLAVLTSGGLDSAILLAHLAGSHDKAMLQPLYVRSGLSWEEVERHYLQRYLEALKPRFSNIAPLIELHQPVLDLYDQHWSITGQSVPDENTPDEAVFLPGRNALLSLKALLWCHLHRINQVVIGILGSNPFPDATEKFLTTFASAVAQAVNNPELRIIAPFASMHKCDIMLLGRDLPLEWSFSCIKPQQRLHCGHCNKCAERKKAFRDAGMPDPTRYAR